jgi:hypothetical protein
MEPDVLGREDAKVVDDRDIRETAEGHRVKAKKKIHHGRVGSFRV